MTVMTIRGKAQALNCKANTESAVRGGPGRSSEDASRKGGRAKGEDRITGQISFSLNNNCKRDD
jgi:hypothetical protein